MYKSRKPRGHFWTCASAFQQTKDYHNLALEDEEALFTSSGAPLKVYHADPDHGLSGKARGVKRRRIEHLAHGFMNGLSLNIASATQVIWEKSWLTTDAIESSSDWQDVPSDREYLRATNAARLASLGGAALGGKVVHSEQSLSYPEQTEIEDRALAVHYSQPRSSRQRLHFGQTAKAPHPDLSIESLSTDREQEPTVAWTSGKRLRTSGFRAYKKSVDEDCSQDELGASSVQSPSQRIRQRTHRIQLSKMSSAIVLSDTDDIVSATSDELRCTIGMSRCPTPEQSTCANPPDPEIAKAGCQSDPSAQRSVSEHDTKEDSQARFPRQRVILATPRKTKTFVDQTVQQNVDFESSNGVRLNVGLESINDIDLNHASAPKSTIRAAVGERVEQSVGKPRTGRSLKSTGLPSAMRKAKVSTRRRSAPPKSQLAAENVAKALHDRNQKLRMSTFRLQDNAAMGHGSLPFVIKKRTTGSNDSQHLAFKAISATHQALDAAVTAIENDSKGSVGAPEQSTPEQSQHFATTLLIDKHLNTILPRAHSTSSRTLSVGTLLREEFVKLGAEISSMSEGTMSPQLSPSRTKSGKGGTHSGQLDQADTQTNSCGSYRHLDSQAWPGGQVMLAQAQHDLLDSPMNLNPALCLVDSSLSNAKRPSSAHLQHVARKPLQPFPQVQVPSSQDECQGW